ncbi:MAG: TetR/AcrR family transcriptional regulator [Pseudomonas sp.]|uniref:TetR/AcrR family transcriptional regulator n=1 Tax=Pseudomonas sp. TaxID=306 RepID=UPI003BB6BE8E
MTPVQKRIHQAAMQLFAEKGVGDITVSELAQVAGVARGTIYNNLSSVESLFEEVAGQLSAEMNRRVVNSADPQLDPAQRLANGIRFYIRRAHDEPQWGSFITRYASSNKTLQKLWSGPPVHDVLSGIAQSRYSFPEEQLTSVMSLIGGAVLAAMLLVLEGHKTWRVAGSETTELVLRALGIAPEEARSIALQELPPLAAAD